MQTSLIEDHPTIFSDLAGVDFNALLQDDEAENTPSPYDLNNLECLYWDTDKLSQHITKANNDLFLHFNIQNLPTKYDNLCTFLNVLSANNINKLPRVLALSETWLNNSNEKAFPIAGFHPIISNIRQDNSSRGGVALYVRDDSNFVDRPDLNIFVPFTFESVFTKITELNITVGVIYRSPAADIREFMQIYQQLLLKLDQTKERFLLLGDFNIDLLDYNTDADVSEFVDINFELGNIPVITKPTRISDTTASCLDNIIINSVSNGSFAGILIEDISDHLPVFYINETFKAASRSDRAAQPRETFRDYSSANITKLNDMLACVDWTVITKDSNPTTAAEQLNNILSSLIGTACPLKSKKIKKIPNQPWFTRGLKTSSKRKINYSKKPLETTIV